MRELLIVGGLTVDRFADGGAAPGGSVLHAGVAAVAEGVRPTVLTVAGAEPEARDGLRRLAGLGELLHQPATATTAFRHHERDGQRLLVYEAAGSPIDPRMADAAGPLRVALLAPIADELSPAAVASLRAALRPRLTVLLVQGWLRRLELGRPVRPIPLDEVSADLWATFAKADAIVLSTEDLAETPEDPFAQAAALRGQLGPDPLVLLTLGSEGYLLDDPAASRVVATVPRRVVRGVPTVGAGDTFGAVLALRLARGDDPAGAAHAATERVIRILHGRGARR